MRIAESMRLKLIALFLGTIAIPFAIVLAAIPAYSHKLFAREMTDLSKGTMNAMIFNIDVYLDDLERLTISPYLSLEVMNALKLKSSGQYARATPYAQYEAEYALTVTLPKYLKNTRKDILGSILLAGDGSTYVTSDQGVNRTVPNFPFTEQEWYRQAVAADGRVAFISAHPQDYLTASSVAQVFSVARLIRDPDSGKPLGVIMADADSAVLATIVRNIRFNVRSIVAIFDDKGKLLYANRPLPDSLRARLLSGDASLKYGQERYAVIRSDRTRANWQVAILLSTADIQAKLRWIYVAGYALACGGLLAVLLLYVVLSRWLVEPFKNMIRLMKKVQRGDLDSRLDVRGRDEVAQLGRTLNTMVVQLKDLIDREYRAVLSKREAEYRALQSQIQPHFLYNTLNGFIAMSQTGQNRLLEKAIYDLSGMLRYILEHNERTTIGEELQFLEKYASLQKIRFEERLRVRFERDPGTDGVRIPKLLLQPLLENAVIHGVEPSDRAGEIVVSAYSERAGDDAPCWQVVIEVSDNGVGFDGSAIEQIAGVGLNNVRQRLQLAFERARLSIRSAPGEGTTVRLIIPGGDGMA